MPIIFTKNGMEHTRDASSKYNLVASSDNYDEGVFTDTIQINLKSFDIFIEYSSECMLSGEECHIIHIQNSEINEGDNIVINNTSGYRHLHAHVYNIQEGSCSVELVNVSDEDIPSLSEGETEEIKLTLSIIN